MGEQIKLKATDGQELSAYKAVPNGQAKAAVVVLQEIFGVNSHIRSIVDRLAQDGYVAVAPALFDRLQPDVELSYQGDDFQKGIDLMMKLDTDKVLLDIQAAYAEVQAIGPVGVVGFCYGGRVSWLSATRGEAIGLKPAACVAFYPGGIGQVAEEKPSCPVEIHLGLADTHIDRAQVDAVKTANPEVEIFFYEGAGHGFHCDQRADYNPEAAKLAWARTLEFFGKHLS